MAEEQPQPAETAPPAPRVGTLTRALWAVVAIVGISNLVLASAYGSYVGQNFGDPQIAAAVVGAGAIIAVAVVPVVLAVVIVGQMRSRGVKIKVARTTSALVVLWNVLLFAGLVTLSPEPTSVLLGQRGTWILDAARGVGPFGPAAEPLVAERLEELAAIETLSEAAPYLSDETAAGLGSHWLVMLDGTRRGAPDESKIDVLIGKHQIDIEALRDDPTALPEDLDGRALVTDIGELMKDAKGPTFMPDTVPVGEDIVSTSRTTMSIGHLQEARFEDGAWRIHLGDVATLTAGTEQQLANAQRIMEGMGGTTPAPTTAEPEDELDPFEGPRGVLEQALRGQAGLLTGTTAFFAEWPDSLTRSGAVAQAEALRTSCAKAAGTDSVFAAEHTALRDKYGISEGSVPDPTVVAQLEARGRRYLTDVLTLCAPVFRLTPAASPGGLASEAKKARWAKLDAAEQAEEATFREDGDALEATIGSATLRLVEEDGAWRVAL